MTSFFKQYVFKRRLKLHVSELKDGASDDDDKLLRCTLHVDGKNIRDVIMDRYPESRERFQCPQLKLEQNKVYLTVVSHFVNANCVFFCIVSNDHDLMALEQRIIKDERLLRRLSLDSLFVGKLCVYLIRDVEWSVKHCVFSLPRSI